MLTHQTKRDRPSVTGADRRGAAIKELAGPGWSDLMAEIIQWCLSPFQCGQSYIPNHHSSIFRKIVTS